MMSTVPDQSFRIYYLSEQALTIEFGQEIAEHIFRRVHGFNDLLYRQPFPGFVTTVPAYATLTVYYDVLKVASAGMAGADCFDKVSTYLTKLAYSQKSQPLPEGDTITIPVCYGGDWGPDIDEVASLNQLSVQKVIQLHSAVTYLVYMIGFVPGFAYMGGLDEKLATPRKTTPRKAVPTGSVGIAGQQTGIYPLQSPRGWQIIGQTPLTLFDAHRSQPSLLKAGDQVIFKPIGLQEFNDLSAG